MLVCIFAVVITAVKGIGDQFLGFKITFLDGLDGWNNCVGITLMSLLDLDMGNELQGLIFLCLVITKGLHELNLIDLLFMDAVGRIRI